MQNYVKYVFLLLYITREYWSELLKFSYFLILKNPYRLRKKKVYGGFNLFMERCCFILNVSFNVHNNVLKIKFAITKYLNINVFKENKNPRENIIKTQTHLFLFRISDN